MPFDLDVLDASAPPPTPRERLLRLLPELTSEQVQSLVWEAEQILEARCMRAARIDAEATAPSGPGMLASEVRA